MNLSSYLQMPPAPLVPNSTSPLAAQGARVGAGPSAGANLGFDFAEVMARQMQRLVPQQRQTLAAETPPNQETQARSEENSQYLDNKRSAERFNQDTRDTRADKDAARPDTHAEAQTDSGEQPTSHARQRARAIIQKTVSTDATLPEGLPQAMPVMPAASVAPDVVTSTPAQSAQANGANTSTPLQMIELSSHVRIITDPQKAPSPESLAAFAKTMGLDESAIQNLLGQTPTTPVTDLSAASAASVTGLPTANLSAVTPHALQAAIGTALTGLQNTMTSATDGNVSTQLAAMSASAMQTAMPASGAGIGATALPSALTTINALPGLTSTDMAAIQQLQITVLPAAVLPVNVAVTNTGTPAPSTIDMLSLFGTGVDEQDVSALLSRFSEEAGSEGDTNQQASQDDGGNFSSFAQALTRNNAANAAPANAAQATTSNMSEVYDQLSDKMATELAARMHKQLSDGEWKMKFALRPSNLGGVEIQLEMKDGKLDAVFRADNPLTRDLLQNSSQRLREALGNFGINAGQVQIGQGGSNAQQNNSGHASRQPQVRDNSSSQVNGSDNASSVSSTRNKANASLLDLYA